MSDVGKVKWTPAMFDIACELSEIEAWWRGGHPRSEKCVSRHGQLTKRFCELYKEQQARMK